jgi:uncharacterized protein YbjT (DUF2867 family)
MKKTKIFITGATGNVGRSILSQIDYNSFSITVAVRDIGKALRENEWKQVSYVQFDFDRQIGFDSIEKHDIVFLLRPPQIGNVKKCIEPFLDKIVEKKIALTVFLSVQGADKKGYIPHSKIERAILKRNIPHVFLRPSYFMDNLTTTLYDELEKNKRIYLPSRRMKFNWIDTADIGAVCVRIFENYEMFINKVVTLTNTSNQTFDEIVDTINDICKTRIRYVSPNILSYVVYMVKNKHSIGYIAIMLLLHFLPRFEKEPEIHYDIVRILNRNPNQISNFIEKNKVRFENLR